MRTTTLKSLEKLVMEVNADLVKGLMGLSEEMRELKDKLVIQMKKVVELKISVKLLVVF